MAAQFREKLRPPQMLKKWLLTMASEFTRKSIHKVYTLASRIIKTYDFTVSRKIKTVIKYKHYSLEMIKTHGFTVL